MTEEAIWLYQIDQHSAQENLCSQFRSYPLHFVTLPEVLLFRDPSQLTKIMKPEKLLGILVIHIFVYIISSDN